MNIDEKLALFDELIEASTVLAQMSDQAATILDERFESVVRGPIDNVRDILSRCPPVGELAWDGSFRAQDCETEFFANDRYVPAINGEEADPLMVGVRITHTPSGLSRESKSKNSRDDNYRVALGALVSAVARENEQR